MYIQFFAIGGPMAVVGLVFVLFQAGNLAWTGAKRDQREWRWFWVFVAVCFVGAILVITGCAIAPADYFAPP